MKKRKFTRGDLILYGRELYIVDYVPGDSEYDEHEFIQSNNGLMLKSSQPWKWVWQKDCKKIPKKEAILIKLCT